MISPPKEKLQLVFHKEVSYRAYTIIHINDIVKIFNHADDMTVYFTDSSNDALFCSANNDFYKMQNWCFNNRLTINGNKTHYTLFSNRTKDILPNLK